MLGDASGSQVGSIVENARSSTVTEERLTEGYLKHDIRLDPGPLSLYLGHVEQPHFVFYNKRSGLTLADERGTEEVEPKYSNWAFLVVTDRGLHFVITSDRTVELDIPMEEVRSIDAEVGWGSKEIVVGGPDVAYQFPINPMFGKSEVEDAVAYVRNRASDTTVWQGWENEVERVQNSSRVGSDVPSGTVTESAEPVLTGSDDPLAVAESTDGASLTVHEDYVVVGQPGSPVDEPSSKRFAVENLQRVERERPSRLGPGWVFVKEKNGLVFDSEHERLESPNAVTFDRYTADEFREAAEVLAGLIDGKGRRPESETGIDRGSEASECSDVDGSMGTDGTDDADETNDADDEQSDGQKNPEAMLKQRFAAGEIDVDEYQERLEVLRETK